MKKGQILFLIVLSLTLNGCVGTTGHKKIETVCFNERCYNVELAETDEQRQTGLMYREHLDADRGMLFVYEEVKVYAFWMKNTRIPLDIIWLASDGTVMRIVENAEPCTKEYCPSINPNKKAGYVLEINGGEAGRMNLSEGSKMEFVYSAGDKFSENF